MEALFPCASVTGAPKIRTMELIAELEKEPRGIYTGAIGYFAPDGAAAFNVAIRTLVVERGGRGEMGIGSGVVYDSHGAREFDECLLKGRFLDECVESFSLVETMRLENGQIHLLERHLARLEHSAARLGFPPPLGVPAELAAVTRAHPGGRFKIRLLFDREGRTDLTIERQPEAPAPPLRFALGTEPVRSSEVLLRHKTTHRPLYQRAWKVAGENALDEIVFRNERDEITEGTRTNIFVEIDGVMWTPPVGSGLLAGTLRGHLLSAGKCRERVLEASDIFGADRIFLGNSVMGLVDAQCEESVGETEGAQRGG
jgi:para-aminobenzoate synthetase/4-amino-4-deoxychorismate lyase